MSLPLGGPASVSTNWNPQGCNLVGAQVYPVTDLGMTSLLGVLSTSVSGGNYTSPAFSTGAPATVMVIGQTASGTCKCVLATNSATSGFVFTTSSASGNFTTAALPGTLSINTTSVNPYFSFQLTDSGTTSTFVNNGSIGVFAIFVLYVLTAGEGWSNVFAGWKAVASRIKVNGQGYTSDGSGTTVFTIQ